MATANHISCTSDFAGKTFGDWLILGKSATVSSRAARQKWHCRCRCGTIREVQISNIVYGKSTGCGCAKRTTATHGMSQTATYRVWKAMKRRCYGTKTKSFANYGGRGITVCERWRNSFENFLADIGPRPSPAHTIERVDNSGNYSPGNCCWILKAKQMKNTRRSVVIAHDGTTLIASDWAKIVGVDVSVICWRLRHGWSQADSLLPPTK